MWLTGTVEQLMEQTGQESLEHVFNKLTSTENSMQDAKLVGAIPLLGFGSIYRQSSRVRSPTVREGSGWRCQALPNSRATAPYRIALIISEVSLAAEA